METLNLDDDNRWWKHLTKNFTVRDLIHSDIDQIGDLIKQRPYLWKSTTLENNDISTYIDMYQGKLKHNDKYKCVGAFYDGKLIMENSAFYPPRLNHWYHLSLRHISNDISLFSGNLQRYLFADCFLPLLNFGEKVKKFTFYSMRSEDHQKIINRMWDRTRTESPLSKYDYYIDGKIPANTKNNNNLYEIFFPNKKTYQTDLVVYIHCLKQKYRLEILNQQG